MLKEFLEKNTHFKITIQHYGILGGGFNIQLYNTTYDLFTPIFEHFVGDFDISNLNANFEAIVLSPITNWLEDKIKERENRNG